MSWLQPPSLQKVCGITHPTTVKPTRRTLVLLVELTAVTVASYWPAVAVLPAVTLKVTTSPVVTLAPRTIKAAVETAALATVTDVLAPVTVTLLTLLIVSPDLK